MNRIGRWTGYIALVAVVFGALMTTANAQGDGWTQNYKAALNLARQQNKMVLMDFTGSDWCPWCMRLDREILSTSEFKQYAAKHLILLKIDFPRNIPQSQALKDQNQRLQSQYGIQGYPTCIILNSQGQKVGQLGYQEGGPGPFIEALNKMRH